MAWLVVVALNSIHIQQATKLVTQSRPQSEAYMGPWEEARVIWGSAVSNAAVEYLDVSTAKVNIPGLESHKLEEGAWDRPRPTLRGN